DPIHVSALSPQPRPRANGLSGHELDARVTGIVLIDGIRVADPASTWCQLAGMVGIPELVAVADAIIMPLAGADPLVTLEELNEAVEIRKGHRGASQLRTALDLVRPGSRNRVESVLRVLLQYADLPTPELHVDVVDSEGSWHTDIALAFPKYKVGVDVLFEADRPYRVRSAELERLARLDDLEWRMLSLSDADVHPSRQYEFRQKLLSLQHLLRQQGWLPGRSAA
ncbi:MAG TPA: hypothetical protein VK139_01775, partial [Microbacteriaceae bacterium]|nr:hypothetical protein [Microbacteriaceae bacterium]